MHSHPGTASHLWHFVTNLGDAGVLLPLAALLALALWRYASPGAAWMFLRALIGCALCLAILKLAFISCGRGLQFQSPSGHTGLSIMVYGALALVAMSAAPGAGTVRMSGAGMNGSGTNGIADSSSGALRSALLVRTALMFAASFLTAAIAVSRIELRDHTLAEVLVGGSVGLLALSGFMVPYRYSGARPRLPLVLLAFAAAAVLAASYGAVSPAERVIRHLSFVLSADLNVCR